MNSPTMEYWINHADSFLHQIFMIVMAGLYGFAWIIDISYKAANIYFYFVLFPLSFFLFLKGWKRILIFPVSLLFFLLPGYEQFSVKFFDRCVEFLNYLAEILNSNYIAVSVYFCVLVPLLLYVPLMIVKVPRKKVVHFLVGSVALFCIYMILIYPNFRTFLVYLQNHYA